MGPLTKRKYAKARQGERRAHLALKAPEISECPNCHKMKRPHTVCPECGFYNGVQVIKPKTKSVKKAPGQ